MTTAAENIIIQQNAQIIALLERLTAAPTVASAAVAPVIPEPKKQSKKEQQAAGVYAWKEQLKPKLNPVMAAILDKHFNKKYLR